MLRRSPDDREILRLALPALGALAAEPLYLLVDTAIVGHLGTRQLAALALAATVLGVAVSLCNFLAYATTAQVARRAGAGAGTGELAAQAGWLAITIGVVLGAVLAGAAGPLMSLVGGSGPAAVAGARYVRLSAPGVPCALLALAGQGYLRGAGDLRTPLAVVGVTNTANVLLEVGLVYGAGLGLDGSALGTVGAQLGMGVAFAVLLARASSGAPQRPRGAAMAPLLRMGGALVVRTGALLGSFTLAGAVLARVGEGSLAAHQIAFQLFLFLALALDAIAIAGQVLVGRRLGAGDADGARSAARRMLGWALVVGVLAGLALEAGHAIIPRAFTGDDDVLGRAAALWPLLALLMPSGALVFALDGVLIGAGDARWIAAAMVAAAAVFVPLALLALHERWGVTGVWAAINALMLVRLATMAWRFAGGGWAVVGAGG